MATDHPKPKRRWYQYSLRTLLIAVTLFAIPCGWLAVKMQEKRREWEVVAEIEKLGGVVHWSEPAGRVGCEGPAIATCKWN
jgi:hypothetical protein